MWVHFQLVCPLEVQYRLHSAFRPHIKNWRNLDLIRGCVMTYHSKGKPTDSLYLCLDIPTVPVPVPRTILLSEDTRRRIPIKIMRVIVRQCEQEHIAIDHTDEAPFQLHIKDYELQIQQAKRKQGKSYYRGAPVEEILRFASAGTEVALEILQLLRNPKSRIPYTSETHQEIEASLKAKLGQDYLWMYEARHIVLNAAQLNPMEWWKHGFL